jgi:Zn-dependent protease with chaperone function
LVLVIGLPLAAGMSMRQVAGVLAHEFGHFAQGAGMRFN